MTIHALLSCAVRVFAAIDRAILAPPASPKTLSVRVCRSRAGARSCMHLSNRGSHPVELRNAPAKLRNAPGRTKERACKTKERARKTKERACKTKERARSNRGTHGANPLLAPLRLSAIAHNERCHAERSEASRPGFFAALRMTRCLTALLLRYCKYTHRCGGTGCSKSVTCCDC